MAKENQNFQMWAGETKRVVITVTDSQKDPVDLSGAKVVWAMQMQVYNGMQPRVVKSTESGGITFPDAPGGVLEIELDPPDTENLPTGVYYHEAEITDFQGRVSVVTTGSVTLKPSITD